MQTQAKFLKKWQEEPLEKFLETYVEESLEKSLAEFLDDFLELLEQEEFLKESIEEFLEVPEPARRRGVVAVDSLISTTKPTNLFVIVSELLHRPGGVPVPNVQTHKRTTARQVKETGHHGGGGDVFCGFSAFVSLDDETSGRINKRRISLA
ncbi:hypothetical protein RP20_CCG017041 [Aedes albopictus]|nr:hypothetical protein RP20_CCG017041 [Aedes albopictus]